MKISIIVCTHNRCEILRKALESLVAQDYPKSDYEVLVVDNCSTDRTKDVVYEFMGGNSIHVRYSFEEKIGLSNAKNRGINESRGDIIAFIDDDAVADKSWLSEMMKVYNEHKNAMCVGGRIILDWTMPKPSWWHSAMDIHFSALDYGNEVKRLSYPSYPLGGNNSFRRAIFKTVGIFESELGRTGSKLLAGEEIEMCLRIERNGGTIYYAPNMVIYHLVHPERVNKKFITQKSYWHGRSCALVEIRHFSKKRVFRRVLYMVRELIRSFIKLPRDVHSLSLIYYRLGYIQQGSMFWKG